MKQTLTIRWWHDDADTINEGHKNELEQHALERVTEMRKETYICGELHLEIEGIYYNGWWEFK